MSTDKDSLENLNRYFEERKAQNKAQFEQELQERLQKIRPNKPLREVEIEKIKQSFWQEKQPILDQRNRDIERKMFQDFGGSQKTAKDQSEQYQRDLARQNLREQWKKNNQAQLKDQEVLAQEHKKREEEKKKVESEQLKAQQNKQVEREKLRNQFNELNNRNSRSQNR